MRIISLIIILLATSSCISMLFSSGGSQKSKIYHYQPPQSPWQTVAPGIDDIGFQNSLNQGIMTINSVCGQYQDLSLEELSKNVTGGVQNQTSSVHREFTVDGFSALESTVSGTTDGEPIKAIFTVIRSSTCVYDFIYASKPEHFEQGAADFRALVSSFTEDRK